MKWAGKFPLALFNKEADWPDDSWKVMLANSSFSPDQDTLDYKDDVTNEVVGTGYTAGGQALANKTITYTAGTNVIKLDADDLVWTTVTLTDVKNVVLYDDTPGTAGTKPVMGYGIIDTAVAPNAGNLTLTFDANGILTMTAAT
jgi:hypothetical protein